MTFPEDLKYAKTHEWARLEPDGLAAMGITDFAQDELTGVSFVELPEPGLCVARGQAFIKVESAKAVSDVHAPVSGTVRAVNQALADEPELVNADPYGRGWMARIEPSDPAELDALLSADKYRAFLKGREE